MIECIFTLDYEIYGNGRGALRDLILDPANRLMDLFEQAHASFVAFVEVAELQKIEACQTDAAIKNVNAQIQELQQRDCEIALHLHPQWCNAEFRNGAWELDYREYNLCPLGRGRINEIVSSALDYLRRTLADPEFTPLSFRAGNWLFQPTATAAHVLLEHGIRLDSSVFKGGRQHWHHLDYRRATRNGYFWAFENDVNVPDPAGALLEIPIYTRMVPFWKMFTTKRVGLQNKGSSGGGRVAKQRLFRVLDLLRFRHPLKLDFCRMTLDELVATMEIVIRHDKSSPTSFKPVVAIGHTKDLVDYETIRLFLQYLESQSIRVSTFREVYDRCLKQTACSAHVCSAANGAPASQPGIARV